MTSEVSTLKIRNLVEGIRAQLDCTQKTICSLAGVTQTSLSTSIEKPYVEVRDKKVAKRLMSLLYVIETLKRDQSLNAPLILKVLSTPCYRMEDGTFLDVVSAIHSGKFNHEFLVHVADAALAKFRKGYQEEKRPVTNGLYNILRMRA